MYPSFPHLPTFLPSNADLTRHAKNSDSSKRPHTLTADTFFSRHGSKPNKPTQELFRIAKASRLDLTPNQLHEKVLRLLSQGANPHYYGDKAGENAADRMQNLRLYSDEQYNGALNIYQGKCTVCQSNKDFNIRDYSPGEPKEKPLRKTLDVLREWAVNGSIVRRTDDNASLCSENTPLLSHSRQTDHTTFRK